MRSLPESELPEFAEEYSARERIRFVVVGATIGAAMVAAGKLWLFPWIGEFARSAACHTILGAGGVAVLWHSLFVGLPLLGAVTVAATVGRQGYKILRDGQTPPLRDKVFRPTRIRRGTQASVIGYLHLLAFLPLLALAIWGVPHAQDASRQGQHRPCVTAERL